MLRMLGPSQAPLPLLGLAGRARCRTGPAVGDAAATCPCMRL